MRHIVLVAPQIPANTGNIGRLCLGFGASLHLVGPLGFSLESKQLKRAGLDYWPQLDVKVYENWESFQPQLDTFERTLFVSKFGNTKLSQLQYQPDQEVAMVFGSENRGVYGLIDSDIIDQHEVVCIPMSSDIRSFNLANSVSIVLWDTIRTLPK